MQLWFLLFTAAKTPDSGRTELERR
jgi:hypothetical protein